MNGRLDSWAVRWCYSQSRLGMFSVTPVVSLVKNNGLDGSGSNSKKEDATRYGCNPGEDDSKETGWCYSGLKPDRKMLFGFYKKYHLSIYVRLRDKYRQIMNTGKDTSDR